MIEVRDISVSYPGPVGVLRDVSFRIRKGERIALMGCNGSGKTTLIRCLNGLVMPGSGDVLIDGRSIRSVSGSLHARNRIGMVFQEPDDQMVAVTVEREIAFGLENIGLPRPQMLDRVDEALNRFRLAPYRGVSPHLLSGGERQRLALAAVWVMHPDYYILDEPTSLLDPETKADVFGFLDEEMEGGNRAFLMATQYPEEALRCGRLMVLFGGRIAADGPPGEVFSDTDAMAGFGIRVPAGMELSRFMKEQGFAVPTL
ncbi:ATP-binding cassette domain-containing protein [bacterium]|nr:ATP-binding cassette domain-containing protein [bacterium]